MGMEGQDWRAARTVEGDWREGKPSKLDQTACKVNSE